MITFDYRSLKLKNHSKFLIKFNFCELYNKEWKEGIPVPVNFRWSSNMVISMFFFLKIVKFVLNFSVYTKKSKSPFIKFLSNVYDSCSNRSLFGPDPQVYPSYYLYYANNIPKKPTLTDQKYQKVSNNDTLPKKTPNNPNHKSHNLQKSWQNHPNIKIPFFFSTSSVKTQIENDYYEIIISRIKQLISKLKQVIYEVIMIKRERSRGGNWLIV